MTTNTHVKRSNIFLTIVVLALLVIMGLGQMMKNQSGAVFKSTGAPLAITIVIQKIMGN